MYKFDKNAVVCFLGDSITARGRWIDKMLDFYRSKYPDGKIKMFNCGRPGGNATVAVKRMEIDVIPHKPTDVVVMFGMNDICHSFYTCEKITEETLTERMRILEEYKVALIKIADRVKEIGANLIFCTPTPTDVDQISDLHYEPGTKLGLQRASEIVKEVAENYGGHIVDFQTEMSRVIENLRKENVGNNIIDCDRVHPLKVGEEVMCKIFLKAQGFDVPIYKNMAAWLKEENTPFSDYTKPIWEVEHILRYVIAFVDWSILRDVSENEKEKTLDEQYNSPDTSETTKALIDNYRENIGRKAELEKELLELADR